MNEEGTGKTRGGFDPGAEGGQSSHPPPPPNYYYGTFQGVANYQPQPPPYSHPVMGFPQPVPPPGFCGPSPHHYYQHGYVAAPGYAVINVRSFRVDRLPCCGLGIGWCLFIIGFIMGAIPWYIGAFLLACARLDYREKPGLIACTIAAVLATVAVTLGMTRASHSW